MVIFRKDCLFLFVLSVLFIAGCSKENEGYGLDIPQGDKDKTPQAIEFTVPYKVSVKASELRDDNILNFGVFAALAENDETFLSGTNLKNFMTNIPVQKGTGSGGSSVSWNANPTHYWPVTHDKSISFFAYAPYVNNNSELSFTPDWNGNKELRMKYTPKANPSGQIDLCLAQGITDKKNEFDAQGNTLPVNFKFYHTLSWITFAANFTTNGKTTVPEGCDVVIDELVLYNVCQSNTLICKSTLADPGDPTSFFSWDTQIPDSEKTGKYTLSLGGSTLGGLALPEYPAAPEEFVNANGFLYLIPQTINSPESEVKAKIDISFSYVLRTSTSSTTIAQFYSTLTLPETVWREGSKIKYTFTIDVSTASLINISAIDKKWIQPWEDSQNQHQDTEIK